MKTTSISLTPTADRNGAASLNCPAVAQYTKWSAGRTSAWFASFHSYTEAHQFVRLAGGTGIRRVGNSWNWTMPDGATASIEGVTTNVLFTPQPA
jgi:hypothetical protein